jgi:mannose-1-phosphate guanylyltransferase
MDIVNVLLSGGVGSRLWPLSRKSCPKQYLPIFEGKSLFELSVERNEPIASQTIIVGNASTMHLAKQFIHSKSKSKVRFIAESSPRNTAAAICLACLDLAPTDIVLVCPSDHMIGDPKAYLQAIHKAYQLACKEYIVTIGITPNYPETGYGYMQYKGNDVMAFREKPSLENATHYLESGDYLWNAGIFCFQAGVFLKELESYEPEILTKTKQAWAAQEEGFIPVEYMDQIPAKSVDYAVMEKSQRLKVVAAEMGWSDLGSFDSMWDYQEKNQQAENVENSNFVISQSSRHIELIGVENLIVVETADAILVVPRYQSQAVKDVYERLQNQNSSLVD